MSSGDLKQERILAAALDVFSTKGFANATVQEIAQKARVGKGTFYTYFATKEEVLTRIIDDGLTQMVQHISSRIKSVTGSVTKLRAVLLEQLRYFRDNQPLCRLITREVLGHREQLATLAQKISSAYIKMLKEVIDSGIEGGELKALDAETVAAALYGMLSSVALYSRQLPNDEALERVAATLQELVLCGISHPRVAAQEF